MRGTKKLKTTHLAMINKKVMPWSDSQRARRKEVGFLVGCQTQQKVGLTLGCDPLGHLPGDFFTSQEKQTNR